VAGASLNECLEASQDLSTIFIADVKRGVNDILNFYGSVYVPSYTSAMRRDRIDL
jgi:hypothetical protein